MAKKAKPKTSKPKKVVLTLIPSRDPLYAVLTRVLTDWHPELVEAGVSIALLWRSGIKADRDGHMTLAYAQKASDLQKEFAEYDAVIVLNSETWALMDDKQQLAVMDHETRHVALVYDKATGEVKRDDRGRPVVRMRGHDIEEFRDIVKRHGLYRSGVEEFVRVALEAASKKPTLFDAGSEADGGEPGKQEAV